MTARARTILALTGAAATVLASSACTPGGTADSGKPTIVTSTNAWGSVARAVAGDDVEVKSIISDPAADPHSYEGSPRDAAKLSDADLVVFNGGGYDDFVEQILSANDQQKPTVKAMDSEHGSQAGGEGGHDHGGHDHGGGAHESDEHGGNEPEEHEHGAHQHGSHQHGGHQHSANEHAWYDLHAVGHVADHIADELGRIQPDKAAKFHQSAERFHSETDGLQERVQDIAARQEGKKVIVTEPVAHYLIEQSRLEDITPQSFVNAVESENDPSAASVAELQDSVNSRQAAAMVYNPQTESRVTQGIRDAAMRNGTPIVEMTETLPPGKTYQQWMSDQISALDGALGTRP